MGTVQSPTSFGLYNQALDVVSDIWKKPVEMIFYPLAGRCEMDWKATSMAAGTIVSVSGVVVTFFAGTPVYCAGFTVFFVCCLVGNSLLQQIQDLMPLNEISGRLGVTATQLEHIREDLRGEVNTLSGEVTTLRGTNEELSTNVDNFRGENDRLTDANTTFEERLDIFEHANDYLNLQVERFDQLNVQCTDRQREIEALNLQSAGTQRRLEELTDQLGQIRTDLTGEREALVVVRGEIYDAVGNLTRIQRGMAVDTLAHQEAMERLRVLQQA